jgi:hypothetical protein
VLICSERKVLLAGYKPATSNQPTVLFSEQTSNQQPASSTFLSEQISSSHQPPAKQTG